MASSQMGQPDKTEDVTELTLQTFVVRYALLLELIERESDDLARRLQSKLAAGRQPDQPRLRVHVGERPKLAEVRFGRAMVQLVGKDAFARQRKALSDAQARCRLREARNCDERV